MSACYCSALINDTHNIIILHDKDILQWQLHTYYTYTIATESEKAQKECLYNGCNINNFTNFV